MKKKKNNILLRNILIKMEFYKSLKPKLNRKKLLMKHSNMLQNKMKMEIFVQLLKQIKEILIKKIIQVNLKNLNRILVKNKINHKKVIVAIIATFFEIYTIFY